MQRDEGAIPLRCWESLIHKVSHPAGGAVDTHPVLPRQLVQHCDMCSDLSGRSLYCKARGDACRREAHSASGG
jgi:hypothetical protein